MTGQMLRWRRGGCEFTATPIEVKDAEFDRKHPRDRIGEFTRVAGGLDRATGTVASAATREAGNGQGGSQAMTDAEYEAHVAAIRSRIDNAVQAGLTTAQQHTVGGDGHTYYPERAAQHKAIVDELYGKYAHVPSEGKAVFAGGLGGAGKTTTLRKFAGIDTTQYATVNPDDIKEIMARRGMAPTVEGLSPMETAPLIHEESGLIANILAMRLLRERKNVIFDSTMSRRQSVEQRIDELKAAGYTNLRGVFVDIPVETSVQRALARHRRGADRYAQGDGYGGRYVPPEIIRSNSSATSSSANRDVFDHLRDHFTSWEIWDNSTYGSDPKPLASSRPPSKGPS